MKTSVITILSLMLFVSVGVHVYRILKPHDRAKSTESILYLPKVGKVWEIKEEYYPVDQPTIAPLKMDSLPSESVSATQNEGMINVALKKPVIYIGKQIVIEEKIDHLKKLALWDRDGVYEKHSLDNAYYPTNLTDGKKETIAYPASWFFDYIIDLEDSYNIKRILIHWGQFGESTEYITNWKLHFQNQITPPKQEVKWTLLKEGNCPKEVTTVFDVNLNVRRFRITAESTKEGNSILGNWIGISEFEAYIKK